MSLVTFSGDYFFLVNEKPRFRILIEYNDGYNVSSSGFQTLSLSNSSPPQNKPRGWACYLHHMKEKTS